MFRNLSFQQSLTMILSNLFQILLLGLRLLHQVKLEPTYLVSTIPQTSIQAAKSKLLCALCGVPPSFTIGSSITLKSPQYTKEHPLELLTQRALPKFLAFYSSTLSIYCKDSNILITGIVLKVDSDLLIITRNNISLQIITPEAPNMP